MGIRLSKILLFSLYIFSLCPALLAAYSSTFVHYSISASLQPASPPVYFQEPPYTTICTYVYRASRGAITYTDFEDFPSGWASRGGSWSITSGYKGYALQGSDDNRGLGGASQYYYNTQLDSYSSLWITVKTRCTSGLGYYGIIMMDSDENRAYTVEIRSTSSTNGLLYIRSYNVAASGAWHSHTSANIPDYNINAWYNIVVNYTITNNAVNIYAWLYNELGSQVISLSASITYTYRFTPAYIGVELNRSTGRFRAQFEDFIISTTNPGYITFQNVPEGYMVEVWDNLGNLVAGSKITSTALVGFTPAYTDAGLDAPVDQVDDSELEYLDLEYNAPQDELVNYPYLGLDETLNSSEILVANSALSSGSVSLWIIRDAVVGTGKDGKIIIKYPDGSLCLVYNVPVTDAIVGGDTYMVTTYDMVVDLGPDDTSAHIYAALPPSGSATTYFTALMIVNSDIKQYYMRLIMDVPSSSTEGLTAYIKVMSGTHSSDPIVISGGSAISQRTSWIILPAYGSGSINVNGYFQAAGSTATINLYLQYSTLPEGDGVTVYYPVSIYIASGGRSAK